MIFRDRDEAARLLGKRLAKYKGENVLVLGIPRGAVPMARQIAKGLECDHDVILVRKLGAPDNPEFAIGAVSEFGDVYLSSARDVYGFSEEYVGFAVRQAIEVLRRRRRLYTPVRSARPLAGRTVIIVDDGIATGSTMLAAVRSARAQRAMKVIVAAPVAARDAAERLGREADETVFLDTPSEFWAISEFYESFAQVSDEEVARALGEKPKNAA